MTENYLTIYYKGRIKDVDGKKDWPSFFVADSFTE